MAAGYFLPVSSVVTAFDFIIMNVALVFTLVLPRHYNQPIHSDRFWEADFDPVWMPGTTAARIGARPESIRIAINDFIGTMSIGSGRGAEAMHDARIEIKTLEIVHGDARGGLKTIAAHVIQQRPPQLLGDRTGVII